MTNPITVIQPAEPLRVNDPKPGMRRARVDRLISDLGNLVLLESYPWVKVCVQNIYDKVYNSNEDAK